MVTWLFLTCGIILGAHWAYSVLGWGGYWGWDPVENASLMPWLTGTAFLHSVMMQEKRGMMKSWNVWLIFSTFMLTILGTLLTRSGVVSSVHAFAQSSIGDWFYGFILIVFAVTGMWHGASWTFILWGLYHGVFVAAEHLTHVNQWKEHRLAWLRRPVRCVCLPTAWCATAACPIR